MTTPSPRRVIRGGYWRSSEAEKFPPESIHTTYFTHLFYATVAIDSNTYKIIPSDIDTTWMEKFTSMAQKAGVKCFLSVGEDTDKSQSAFSNMIRTPDGRKSFINSSIEVARDNGFHGLDLYWKYPNKETEFEMKNLWLLFKEWRESLKKESSESAKPPLLLSTIAYFAPKFFPPNDDKAYPFKAIKDNVDFVNLVCYDYYGSQDFKFTAEPALLYDQKHDQILKKSTDYGISSWIDDARIPEEKLVMGLPLYGRKWTLADPNDNGIGAPAIRFGPDKDYSDIVIFNRDNHAVEVNDDKTVSTYSYAGTDWFGYDGTKSIKGKVQYAKDHELGGYFFWALGMDREYVLPREAFHTWK